MEKPRHIDSGEARLWNEEVARRREAHHAMRCAEDEMYRKAYDYLQAERRRIWEQTQKPLVDMMAEQAGLLCKVGKTKDGHDVAMPVCCPAYQMPENMDVQTVNDCMKDADKPQRAKSREEVMRERAAMESYQRMSDAERVALSGNVLAMGIIGMMFACPGSLEKHMREMDELRPYLDEIHETNKRYDAEMIKLSGFEW